jgi:hypothetical protein
MFTPIYLVIAAILLAASAAIAFMQGQSDDIFAGSMAVAGVVVMAITALLYPLTRRRQS